MCCAAVLSMQSYSLVAVAAVIAGNCRVPLTAILLLFELTHDYTILLPTLGAVGLSYWVSVALDPAASKAAAPISASSSSEEEEGSTTSSSSDPMDTTRCGPGLWSVCDEPQRHHLRNCICVHLDSVIS